MAQEEEHNDVVATSTPNDAPAEEERKARVVVEYAGGDETDDEAGEGDEDAGDPATEDLLAAYPDETEDIDLVHARLHTLANLRLPRFGPHLNRLCLRQNFIAEVGEGDIGALVGLEELDLYDNRLKGVGGALDNLKDLK
ncbi:hypothetical protein FS749_004647 [Ceratobasidium sp. UAMH 11750]|nr:hypothetical protein FS749_004647 [Ceratobasidium sp. UAMH 11750]